MATATRPAPDAPSALLRPEFPTGEYPERHLGLVFKFAMKNQHRGLSLDELISAGFVGLDNACRSESFDPKRSKFSTYASWSIMHTIQTALYEETRIIRIPKCALSDMHRGRVSPTTDAARKAYNVTSLGRAPSAGSDLDDMVWDQLASPGLIDDEDDGDDDDEDDRPCLAVALARLQPRESAVLRMRFGFDDAAPMTLEAVGRVIGVSKERVRQIELRAKSRLKAIMGATAKENT